MKTFTYILTFILLSSCSEGKSNQELPPGLRAGGFKVGNAETQEIILQKMKGLAIPYEIDSKGFVRYMQKDVAEVRQIKRIVQKDGKDSKFDLEEEIAFNEEQLDLYKKKFDKEGVPYKVEIRGKEYRILWRVAYAKKVDQIVEDIGFDFYTSSKNN